ncbi:nad-dependent histone deacetylase sir2 [Stemphylium lycopersici]|uniref:Nad-dependent histone deacetylase sir2 n=1 Tax=Stemphylium lycopersici TaxID=183478 RepID=A0A364MYH6_STELY|nr:nad-dependent histone deacetylase sir2 [Stemphylium lycopersici]RAR11276.1 nad-dependent histone deacetylase sir2 [Stemphylium lycopersici]
MAGSTLNDVPSSPLTDMSDSEVSLLSRSPTPPPEMKSFAQRRAYMSPSSSRRSSAKTTPTPEDMPSPPSSNDDNPRPAKRRKTAEPKERTAEYLDLSRPDIPFDDLPQLQRLLTVLHKKRKIVVIAGAGISVSAGIPDFRSATGLFNTLKKEHKLKSSGKDLFDASVYQDDTSTSTFHDMVRTLSHHTKSAKPTAFHHLLATLAQEGRLMRLYTQNVDGIDTSLPPLSTQVPLPKKGPWPKTVQVHGGLDFMSCSKCHAVTPFDADQFNGPSPPPCPSCVQNDEIRQVADKRSHGIGRLRPRMVLYNEHNPDDESIGSCASYDMRMRPDAVIVAGTTLKVPGVRRIAREMCNIVRDRKDGVTVWLNNDPEPVGKDLEDKWDLVVKGPCDEVARHANMRRWDDPMDYRTVTDEDLSKIKEKQRAEVVIGTPRKPGVLRNAGQLTPGQSPRIQPRSFTKDEPDTPSKKGTKRKADVQNAQMDLFGKVAGKAPARKPKAQPKKASAASKNKAKKEPKKEAPAINNVFKATKGTKKTGSKSLAKTSHSALPIIQSEFAPQLKPPKENVSDVIHVGKTRTPATPRKPSRLTKIKSDYVFQPVSSADSRNNHSPKRPPVESFTPTKDRTPSAQIEEEMAYARATSESRPSSSGSAQRHVIESPKERFEDPNTLQSRASGYFFGSKDPLTAAPTLPELNGHAQSFNQQDLDVTLQPFESYTLSSPNQDQSSTATLSSPTLRITIETAKGERHRIDAHPSYTQKSSQAFTALSANPSATYKAIFHPAKPIPHLAIHCNHLAEYSSWMATLPDSLPLSAISIPGTHNSHTHYRALPSVRCQVADIKTQLENGIRFLDIRVQPKQATDATKKDLYLVHGAFPVSLTGPKYFEPILDMCYNFLHANPTETVLISLKREGVGNATDKHLARILEDHYITPRPASWYTENKIPYLGSVRGKLVLVRRYNVATTVSSPSSSSSSPNVKNGGLDATAWPHNAHHALFPRCSSSASSSSGTSTSHATFCLQDFCEVLMPTLIPTKLQHCNDHLVRSAEAIHPIPGLTTDSTNPVPPGPLYLNFLSASNFWKKACWPSAIAKVVNEGMEEWLCGGHHLEGPRVGTRESGQTADGDVHVYEGVRRAKSGHGSTGIVIMDCVGENGDWELVRLVVGMNMGVLSKYASLS